jgi:hypothetical protein
VLGQSGGASQLALVRRIQQSAGAAVPDLLLLSIGGNDAGYAQLMSALFANQADQFIDTTAPQRLDRFTRRCDELARALRDDVRIRPQRVVVTQYYDISRNERGDVDGTCLGKFLCFIKMLFSVGFVKVEFCFPVVSPNTKYRHQQLAIHACQRRRLLAAEHSSPNPMHPPQLDTRLGYSPYILP